MPEFFVSPMKGQKADISNVKQSMKKYLDQRTKKSRKKQLLQRFAEQRIIASGMSPEQRMGGRKEYVVTGPPTDQDTMDMMQEYQTYESL